MRTTGLAAGALALGVSASGVGAAKKPAFTPQIYGDGEAWGTKGVTPLPPPNDHNEQSFDPLFVITNSNNPGTQLPVSEAAPGNPAYNGGRWFTHTATWTDQGFADHGTVPILTRYGPVGDPEAILTHVGLGHLTITEGSPPGGPPAYFECPLLPVKD